MKPIQTAFAVLICISIIFSSCERDEGRLPEITFKSGGAYLSANDTISVSTPILIGIHAAKTEDKDPLKKFNISKSINGGTFISVLSKDMEGGEGDQFSFDFNDTLDSVVGQNSTYRFTITNRDGIANNVRLTLTGK